MIDGTDLEQLERWVEKAKILVRQSEFKIEELMASVHEIEKFRPKIRRFGKSFFPTHLRHNSAMLNSD